jgi:hypothetical protein
LRQKSNFTCHFGTIIGSANHINAGHQGRGLLRVSSMPLIRLEVPSSASRRGLLARGQRLNSRQRRRPQAILPPPHECSGGIDAHARPMDRCLVNGRHSCPTDSRPTGRPTCLSMGRRAPQQRTAPGSPYGVRGPQTWYSCVEADGRRVPSGCSGVDTRRSAFSTRPRHGGRPARRVWGNHMSAVPAARNPARPRGQQSTAPGSRRRTPPPSACRGRVFLDHGGPSKEQLPMWERRPSRNLGKFLAIARPRSGINMLIRVRRGIWLDQGRVRRPLVPSAHYSGNEHPKGRWRERVTTPTQDASKPHHEQCRGRSQFRALVGPQHGIC